MPTPFEKQIVEEGGIFGGKSRTQPPAAYMASGSEEKLNELIHENMSLLMDWLTDHVVPAMIDMDELKIIGLSLGTLSSIADSSFESFHQAPLLHYSSIRVYHCSFFFITPRGSEFKQLRLHASQRHTGVDVRIMD
jgi:hypothetical protein